MTGEGVDSDLFGDDLDCVVADTLKFKRKLRIGEDAYAVLRAKNGLQSLWDVGGVAMSAGALAASPLIAGTFFASSAGWLSVIGIGVATTPVGWVIAAAAATGGAYYGVTRLVRKQMDTMVETIPRFINTPIDLLGMELFDLIGALAVRVASIDGDIDPAERETIVRHFIDEWGYDPLFVNTALDVLVANTGEVSVKAIAKALAEFQAASPDCNGVAMQAELLTFLRQVIEADGRLDEREELALDGIDATFRAERAITFGKVAKSVAGLGERAGAAMSDLKSRAKRTRPPKSPLDRRRDLTPLTSGGAMALGRRLTVVRDVTSAGGQVSKGRPRSPMTTHPAEVGWKPLRVGSARPRTASRCRASGFAVRSGSTRSSKASIRSASVIALS